MRILRNTPVVLLAIASLAGCSKEPDPEVPQQQEEEQLAAIDVPFDVVTLSEPGCSWRELEYPHPREVILINDGAELRKHIDATDEQRIPVIDFSKKSLLLARGVEPYGMQAVIESLRHNPETGYTLRITLNAAMTTVITNWQVAVVVSRLDDTAAIRLQIGE